MQHEQWDITPHVNLLRSLRADRFKHSSLLGEAIDNSFDAGANRVDITVEPNEISFSDDGVGITFDRLKSLFSLGEHGAMDTTKLGRFGIGIKSQAVNAGDVLEVISTSKDGKFLAVVNWRHLLRSGRWQIDYPHSQPVPVGAPTGTTITISELQKCQPFSFDKSKHEIAQIFRPALMDGKSIILNGVLIEPLDDPVLLDPIDVKLSLSGGRSARLKAGILKHPSALNRVHVEYKHRVIMPRSAVGCGEYSGLTKMFARLQIDGPWTLGKFKDDLPKDSERDELEEAVESALLPILEKCSLDSMSAKICKLTELINEAIPENMRARPKHKGAQPSQNTEKRKRKTGFVEEDESTPASGPAKTKAAPRNRLLITFDGSYEEHGVGVFVPTNRPYRVDLCKDDPFIARLIESRDEEMAVRALYVVAMSLFEHNKGELEFQPFGKRLSNLLSRQDYSNGAITKVVA